MNILFVAPRLPFPADTGAKIRTLNLLKQARTRHKVTLIAFQFTSGEEKAVMAIEALGIRVSTVQAVDRISWKVALRALFWYLPVSLVKYENEAMFSRIKEMVAKERIDLIHYDHLHMGQYVERVKGVPSLIDEHNVEAMILYRLAAAQKNPFKKLCVYYEAGKMAAAERRIVRQAVKVLVVSAQDGEALKKLCGRELPYEVALNGVDSEYFYPQPVSVESSEKIVFTGSMDWLPNSDAVKYFCADILPLIWEKSPQVTFYIVGKDPAVEVRRLAEKEPRITVTGTVDDVRPFLASAKVFVVPLRIGGGTRLKIVEAMGCAKAIVSTTVGAEGLRVINSEHIVLADTPREFADAVLKVLADRQLRDALGKNGRALVEQQYDWKYVGNKVDEVYRGLHG